MEKNCEYCGTPFIASTHKKLYCKPTCKQYAYLERMYKGLEGEARIEIRKLKKEANLNSQAVEPEIPSTPEQSLTVNRLYLVRLYSLSDFIIHLNQQTVIDKKVIELLTVTLRLIHEANNEKNRFTENAESMCHLLSQCVNDCKDFKLPADLITLATALADELGSLVPLVPFKKLFNVVYD